MNKLKLVVFLAIFIPVLAYADSHVLKTKEDVIAQIDENFFDDGGVMTIKNNSDSKVKIFLLKIDNLDPYSREPDVWKEFKQVHLTKGESTNIELKDVVKVIYGIAVVDRTNGKVKEIHQFKWSD
ncbi:hypothetical protein [Labilibaculum euxinus]|uniref:Uncharacterized protein n=1 Tax=Labilibaculum euxinus TaxID=2686357 RepID=A0A7M4D2D8_9BACT|nr:hypothetical protein [Labilibaculum euxinus]MUP36817.1 hypothetical protein [Labilibaculum euxinus]MVB06022.1 hypothetical protein [Labilibaculum euxinus]